MNEAQRRQILVETVKRFGKQEWFRDAVVHDSHPVTGEPTLEIKVNYVPQFERKSVKEFALSVGNLADRFTVVDAKGNAVE
jgi:hypothetical protein